VSVNFSKDTLLNSNIFEDAFLYVFGVLQRLFQSFRWSDSVRDDICVPNRSAELIQALADQGRSPSHGRPVAVEESYLEARASENNGPSATDKADADYCDFSRHFRSMFSLGLYAGKIDLSSFLRWLTLGKMSRSGYSLPSCSTCLVAQASCGIGR
jgi:hypothetical protein